MGSQGFLGSFCQLLGNCCSTPLAISVSLLEHQRWSLGRQTLHRAGGTADSAGSEATDAGVTAGSQGCQGNISGSHTSGHLVTFCHRAGLQFTVDWQLRLALSLVLQSSSDFSREAAKFKGEESSSRRLLAHSLQGLTA